MLKILAIGTFAVAAALGASAAYAANPNVPSWSPYAIMGSGVVAPVIEGRSAYVTDWPASNAPGTPGVPRDLQNGARLSINPDNCNNGCTDPNGG